ncbi:MAG: LacI family DNA-binding transcriptional regulator [Bryobacteraceae bacterium]|nr:LacI family DNA-binding transcriptional regulator [Bryobacteraceae bacterium]
MTLEEVAKRARVSTATASRVLNNIDVVSEATRKRVLQAASELRYHPNVYARTLAGGKNRTLGMIVSNIGNPFFLDIFRSLEDLAAQNGYEVVVENTDYDPERLVAAVRSMIGRRLAGLAVVVSEMEPYLIEELAAQALPIVFYDVGRPAHNITNIRVRYEKGVQRGVEYLYSLGHRRMAFVGHHAALGPLREREATFLRTIGDFAGVEATTVTSSDSPSGGRQAAHELLESNFAPTAILCVNDFMAIGVIRELRDQGLRVPEDVSVTGYDNIDLAEFVVPSLTTANIPRRRIGQIVFEAFTGKEPRGSAEQEILIVPELVVRESTGPANHGGHAKGVA